MSSAKMLVTVFVTSQVRRRVERMNSPVAAEGASPCASAATRCPATTARPSPAARRTSACPEPSCVTDGPTAGTGGTSLPSCALRPGRTRRRVNHPSFGAEMVRALLRPTGATTGRTAPTAAMKWTAVSPQPSVFLQIMHKMLHKC